MVCWVGRRQRNGKYRVQINVIPQIYLLIFLNIIPIQRAAKPRRPNYNNKWHSIADKKLSNSNHKKNQQSHYERINY